MEKFTLTKTKWDGDPAADRDKFIGGSDIGTILGLNPWKSAYTLWAEKTGQVEREQLDNKLQVWLGHHLEQVVADRYELETGRKVHQSYMSYGIAEYPYLRGHIDRLIVGEKRGLECKTTSSYNRTDYAAGEIPPMYYAQCQFYMLVTGYEVWDIATLRDNREFFILTINRDEDYIKMMLDAAKDFWQCVTSVTPPAIDCNQSTSETLTQQYPGDDSEEPLEDVPDDIQTMADDVINLSDTIKHLTDAKNAEISEIKAWMGNHTSAVTNAARISYRAATVRETIDTKALKNDHPEIYAQYAKTGKPYRTFTIKPIEREDNR